MQEDHVLAIAMAHNTLTLRPNATAFVKLCRSVLNQQYPRLIPGDLINTLFEGLFDRRCIFDIEGPLTLLSKLLVPHPILRRAADLVNKRASKTLPASADVKIKIADYEYPFIGDPRNLQLSVMHAALSGGSDVRRRLGVSEDDAARILWSEVLFWQTEYFGMHPPQRIQDLVKSAQSMLASEVIKRRGAAAAELETYALLESLMHPNKGVSFRVSLPRLKLQTSNGEIEKEYDVVAVTLSEDKFVEVWIWGVTTEANLTAKRNTDLTKIQTLKDLVGKRWGSDVRVVTNYVHREDNGICCEINGRQERRPAT